MRNYSEKVAAEIDDEVQSYIGEAYRKCEEILNHNLDSLHAVAGYLLKHEILQPLELLSQEIQQLEKKFSLENI
jgi:cell division protease FtsH